MEAESDVAADDEMQKVFDSTATSTPEEMQEVPVFDSTTTSAPMCSIELKHSRSQTNRRDWCLNNIFAFCNGERLETDQDDLYHCWMDAGSSITINVPRTVTSIAFSSQDAQEIQVTVRGASDGRHAPSSSIPVIHWSNGSHRDGGHWTCEDNNRKEHWSYTVVEISHNPSCHFSSWSSIHRKK